MCTCTDQSRRHFADGASQTNGSHHHVQDFDVAIRTLNRTTLITRCTWHRCNRQRLTLSVFVVRKFVRTDSVFIVQDRRNQHLTGLDTNRQRQEHWHRSKLIQALPAGGITSRYQETSYQNKHRRMVYTACRSHPNERLPTSTVKEQTFLLTKLKTRRQCTCTFYIFQSAPRVVFSAADVLACLPSGDSMVLR